MKKALVFIDYDIIIRHFVHSGAFADLERNYEVTYVFPVDSTSEKTSINVDVAALGLQRVIHLESPRRRMGEWYHLFIPKMLRHHRGSQNYPAVLEQTQMNHVPRVVAAYRLLSLPILNPLFTAYMKMRLGLHAPLEKLLDTFKPDVVIHPSLLAGLFINDLIISCPRYNIPLLVLMNSWDNPSNKAITAGHPTCLAVWGPQSKRHAMTYLGLPEDRIAVLGAAQFEVYRKPAIESREELAKEFGVPTDRPILLFGGASKSLNETGHLMRLDAAIENGHIPQCHIIYRPHPWRGRLVGDEISFFDAGLKHITLDPHMEAFYRTLVTNPNPNLYMADYDVTRRLMNLVDALVSPLSTILLESAMHGKPALALFVDAIPGSPGDKVLDIVKRLVYFSEFIESDGILTCDNIKEMPALVARLIQMAGDHDIAQLLQQHAAKYVPRAAPNDRSYGEKLSALADQYTHRSEKE